jgi:hypothetical protein
MEIKSSMAKKTTYTCDQCGKVLSDEGLGQKHLKIVFNRTDQNGWVEPRPGRIEMVDPLPSGVFQFCDEKCLADFVHEKSGHVDNYDD